MSTEDLILNSSAIIHRVVSYLKSLYRDKQFNESNFEKIYANPRLFYYLDLFLKNRKVFKKDVGLFVNIITKYIYKRRYGLTKTIVFAKCKQEIRKYGEIQF